MDDLISRQAAIDAVSHHGEIENDYTDLYHDGYCDGVYDSADILEDLPAAQQWIPCSERLPKIGKQVLCCDGQSRVFTSALTEIASNGMTFFGQHCKVIAWMPLPEPWEGKQNEIH